MTEMQALQNLETKVNSVNQKVDGVNHKVDGIERNLMDLRTDTTSIIQLLRGNKLDPDDKGFVGKVNEHDDRISQLEKVKDRFFWVCIGFSLPGTYGVFEIISKLVTAIK